MSKIHYTIYKTTNLINNKIYIGLHATENINDGYLGSGVFLKKAIKKYGYKNFIKEILFVFDNKDDMVNKEKELVNEDFINNPKTYNMSKGGFGLSTLSDEKRKETIEKIRTANLENDSTISVKKRKDTLLLKDKNSFKIIGQKSGDTQRQKYIDGHVNPRQIFTPVKIYNDKDEVMFSVLRIKMEALCSENNLPYRVLVKSLHNDGLPIYKNQPPRSQEFLRYKDWYAKY